MRELCTDQPVKELKFHSLIDAKEALQALSRTLKEKSLEIPALVIKEESIVKTEPQGSLLKAVLDGSGSRPLDAALKDSFEARSMKSEEERTGSGSRAVYSLADTAGPLYLKRIQSLAEAKKTSRIVKVSGFMSRRI